MSDLIDEIFEEIKHKRDDIENKKYEQWLKESDEEIIKEIVRRFKCSREEAKKSKFVYVFKKGEKIIIEQGREYYLINDSRRENIIEEYRFTTFDGAEIKGYRLIKKYMKNRYKVESSSLNVPSSEYWEFEIERLIGDGKIREDDELDEFDDSYTEEIYQNKNFIDPEDES